jgi:hypothetical protein
MTTQQDKTNSPVPEEIAKSNNTQDYYIENGYRVLTTHFLINRGYCCGNGCRHCPYHPQHTKGTQTLQ